MDTPAEPHPEQSQLNERYAPVRETDVADEAIRWVNVTPKLSWMASSMS